MWVVFIAPPWSTQNGEIRLGIPEIVNYKIISEKTLLSRWGTGEDAMNPLHISFPPPLSRLRGDMALFREMIWYYNLSSKCTVL